MLCSKWFGKVFWPARLTTLLLIAAAAGCQNREGVRSYTVPRTSEIDKPAAAGELKEYRILGAMFPADQPAWFFKLTGTAEQVEKAEPLFDKVVRSVHFPKGIEGPPEFDVPEGCRLLGGRNVVGIKIHETIRFGPDGPDATVTASRGELLANINRWAGQVGASRVSKADLAKVAPQFEAKQIEGRRIDLHGRLNPMAPAMGGMGGRIKTH